MIKYTHMPNAFDATKSAVAAVLPVFNDEGWERIAKYFADSLQTIWSAIPYGDAGACKLVRKTMLEDITRFTKGLSLKTPVMEGLFHRTEGLPYGTRLQLAFSLADSPKFLMFSEKDLHRHMDRIEEHIGEINAITYMDASGKRLCPYDVRAFHDENDLFGTIMSQSEHILQFLTDSAGSQEERGYYLHNFQDKRDAALQYLKRLPDRIDQYSKGTLIPTMLEKEFFDSILYIRQHLGPTVADTRSYMNGCAHQQLFSLSESKSPITDNTAVMQILHKLGFGKSSCPAVLSNIFYTPKLLKYNIRKQPGQIEIEYDIYFSPAPGLGPGFKIRWVYSIDTNINNALTPLANLIQRADRECDPNEAYNDQLGHLLAYLPLAKDAFCTDATGYSDYLWRGIYTYLMELYGLPGDIIQFVTEAFRIPLRIRGEDHFVEFGTFQGCKLLVFIMNHANRLMGLIADSLSGNKHKCIRPNAGDDVAKISLDTIFTPEEIWDELLTFALFNSPTNSDKSAWLNRDGYFDFCSKYFSKVGDTISCVSGVPAKKYGKEIVCIADWAETFKVLENSGQHHTKCLDAFNQALPFILDGLEEGCKLPNPYKISYTVEGKIRNAIAIPFTYGGLAESDTEQDIDVLLKVLKYKSSQLLSSYTFNPTGVFSVAQRLEDLQGTELFKAIGSINRQPIKELIKLIRLLGTELSISREELEWAKDVVARFERNAINGQSVSRTSSTYHRLERNKDVDMLISLDSVPEGIEMPVPNNTTSAIMMIAILEDKEYVDIDNMRRYVIAMNTIKRYSSSIIRYQAFGQYYYAVRDPDTKKLIRLWYNDDDRYDDFLPLYRCRNESVKNLVTILRKSNVVLYLDALYDTIRDNQRELSDWSIKVLQKQVAAGYKASTIRQLTKLVLGSIE